ncbi:hypothetical protein B0H66DRAFT_534248 [Apodospora peruviana]|uniref:Uncharacterized protein n=1 Tax=Apodospora peruviana TaxID=516989 RepID=A0AAE0I018_9PEZI|nr:hypothetical protein B0H66DRAFT_534248 [Apodospora peruviana]
MAVVIMDDDESRFMLSELADMAGSFMKFSETSTSNGYLAEYLSGQNKFIVQGLSFAPSDQQSKSPRVGVLENGDVRIGNVEVLRMEIFGESVDNNGSLAATHVNNFNSDLGGKLRLFALGIGNVVSHELVEGIAKAGGGYAKIIPATHQGSWESRMVAVLSAALTGHCGPIQIELDDGTPTKPARTRATLLLSRPPAPSPEKKLGPRSLSGFYRKKGQNIHKFAARSLTEDLGRRQSWIQRRPTQGLDLGFDGVDHEPIRKEGERLGSKWSIVSQWTSFVVVKETDPEIEQVVEQKQTQGWDGGWEGGGG